MPWSARVVDRRGIDIVAARGSRLKRPGTKVNVDVFRGVDDENY